MKGENEMKTFEELGVAPKLLKGIAEMGFESPMPIQEMVIPHLLERDGDVVGLAQTGTGKTAAFGLPVLQRIDIDRQVPQALIIAPTRELCLQIAGDLADFSKYIDNLKILPVYGGSSIESQINALKKGTQVIVATPGRLIDLINRGVVKLADVHTVILDEADEMLNMGFLDDINEILSYVPEERKMLMFSATMPKEIAEIANRFMKEPVEFVAGNKNEGSKNVKHIYYMVKAQDKYLALKRVADNNPSIYGIIFCRTRKDTQEIADKLIADGYNADCLHGDLSQAQRDLAMKKFRDHVTQLLVATDVAARGLDVDDLTHVINYGLPDDVAVYTHRSGRTGRANKTGVSVAIIHSREKGKLREIEKKIGKEFEYKRVPSPEHIIEKQLYNMADRLERVEVNEEEIAKYLPGVRKKLEWLSEADLLKRMLSLEFNRLLAYYRDMPDIDLNADAERDRNERRKKGSRGSATEAEHGMERIFLNIGKRDGFFPGNLMELVNKNLGGAKPAIGRIDLFAHHTFFDVRKGEGAKVAKALKNADFYGQRLYAEPVVEGKEYDERPPRGKKSKNEKSEGRRDRNRDKESRERRGESRDRGGRREARAERSERQERSERDSRSRKSEPRKQRGSDKHTSSKSKKKESAPQYNGNFDLFIKKGKKK
jgi:ATP-dependent RNA helicase DeaD